MVERLERVPALVAREDPAHVVRPVRAANVAAPDGEIRAPAAAEDAAEARAVAGGARGGAVRGAGASRDPGMKCAGFWEGRDWLW